MFDPQVFGMRDQFCRDVAQVGGDYLKNTAEALFLITNELSRSLMVEFRIIQQIRRLDVANAAEVTDFAFQFEDYVALAMYNEERTRCHLIAQSWQRQAAPMKFGDDAERAAAKDLENLIDIFSSADFDFIDQVQQSVQAALDVVRSIKAHSDVGDTDAAKAEQDQYATTYADELAQLKLSLKQLTETASALVDKL